MGEVYDILVVGAGPAGLAAAAAAAESGARVGLIDAYSRAGGQIWRYDIVKGAAAKAQALSARLKRSHNVEHLHTWPVVLVDSNQDLIAENSTGVRRFRWHRLILATGARELLLPFPGWTLPGVTGAGGLQALVKSGWPIAGKRVVVGGSGPLLLASADTLKAHRAKVVAIVEQAPLSQVAKFAMQLPRWPGKFSQALKYKLRLRDIPCYYGACIQAASGESSLKSVEVATKLGNLVLECDYFACGFGLVPNVELAKLLNCALDDDVHPAVAADENQQTSVHGIYAAGEICGIGGVEAALIEGRIAGYAASGEVGKAAALFPRRADMWRFADAVSKYFSITARIRTLAKPDTIVCRCEDIPLSAVKGFSEARTAKLATRCGMGPCQGRICGSALAELEGLPRNFGRPPLFPARLDTLACLESASPQHNQEVI